MSCRGCPGLILVDTEVLEVTWGRWNLRCPFFHTAPSASFLCTTTSARQSYL